MWVQENGEAIVEDLVEDLSQVDVLDSKFDKTMSTQYLIHCRTCDVEDCGWYNLEMLRSMIREVWPVVKPFYHKCFDQMSIFSAFNFGEAIPYGMQVDEVGFFDFLYQHDEHAIVIRDEGGRIHEIGV